MPLSGDIQGGIQHDIQRPLDRSQPKWSLPRTAQFVTLACGLSWLLFLICVRYL